MSVELVAVVERVLELLMVMHVSFVYIILRCVLYCLGQQPTAPSNSDIKLLFTATAGSFLLDVQATQPNNSVTSSSPVHSFVVSVVGTVDNSSVTQYWWMVSSYCI